MQTSPKTVPSPFEKKGGLVGEISSLPTVKRIIAQGTPRKASDTGRINGDDRVGKWRKRLRKEMVFRLGIGMYSHGQIEIRKY